MTALIDVENLLDQMAEKLTAKLDAAGIDRPCVIGIRTGGVWLADYLCKKLHLSESMGELDISFYRDDFTRIGLNPKVTPSSLPFATENRHIILVDDVIMSGRTVRAAMNEIFDYGRPASITLVTLIDLGGRELPVQPDIVGKHLTISATQRVKLKGPEMLSLEICDKPIA